MNTHTFKTGVEKSEASGHSLTVKQKDKKIFPGLQDNRPQSILQKKMWTKGEAPPVASIQEKKNSTGMPDQLKSGIENLSGYSMDDVKVHYNSSQPAQLNAHAYAQGNQIHVAPGQEKHLPHEAWHVVQQKQGRVQPTKQLKGKTDINDDASLEKEAEVMGGMALRFSGQPVFPSTLNPAVTVVPTGTYQLQVRIDGEEYDREKLYQLVQKRLNACNNAILTEVVRYSLIPTLVDGGLSYQSMDVFNDQFDHYLKTMGDYIQGFFSLSLPNLIQSQETFQNEIALTNPMLMATLTTSGFEFEFLQMTDESPLKGLSHLELARSMPYGHTLLPFKIETDSSSEIELVTPPFMIPTLGTGSLPHHAILQRIHQLFHDALLPLQAKAHALSEQDRLPQGLQGLLALLGSELGVVFHLAPQKIKTHNLSYNADPQKAKAMIGKKPTSEQLSSIRFKNKNEKYSEDKPIASQVNFASSAETLGLLLSQETLKEDVMSVFSPLYAFWHKYLSEKAPGLPIDYLEHVVQKLASIYAAPLQKIVLDELHELHSKIVQDKALPGETEQAMFASIANLVSFVKDIKHIWVKDDLSSITRAYLKNDKVCQGIQQLDVSDLPDELSGVINHNMLSWGIGNQLTKINQEYIKDCIAAIETLKAVCSKTQPEIHVEGVNFLEHNPSYIGGRQDTYIALNARMKAKGSNRRYIGELRDGGIERLAKMAERIITMEHARYGNDDEVVELNFQQLKEHSEELYKSAYKTYLPDRKQWNDDDLVDPMKDMLSDSSKKKKKHKKKDKKDKKEKKNRKDKKDKDRKKLKGNPRAESVKRLVRTTAETVPVGDIPGRIAGTLFSMGISSTEIDQIIQGGSGLQDLQQLLDLIDQVIT